MALESGQKQVLTYHCMQQHAENWHPNLCFYQTFMPVNSLQIDDFCSVYLIVMSISNQSSTYSNLLKSHTTDRNHFLFFHF